MNHYCTYCDYNYMPMAMALYDSLVKHSKDSFTLHFLVHNRKDYDVICKIPYVDAYLLDDIKEINYDFKILESKFDKKLNDFSPFHFMMTPLWIHHLMKTEKLPHVLYLDADLFFYDDPGQIIAQIEDKEISLCTHKTLSLNKSAKNSGYYNVGALLFKNTFKAMLCLEWWKSVCLDTENPWRGSHGNCGDQKYLELFEDIGGAGAINIMDYKIGHIAPWNIALMILNLENMTMLWRDYDNFVLKDVKTIEQKIVYMHFSHFQFNVQRNIWREQRSNEWGDIIKHAGVQELYANYFEQIKTVYDKYKL